MDEVMKAAAKEAQIFVKESEDIKDLTNMKRKMREEDWSEEVKKIKEMVVMRMRVVWSIEKMREEEEKGEGA